MTEPRAKLLHHRPFCSQRGPWLRHVRDIRISEFWLGLSMSSVGRKKIITVRISIEAIAHTMLYANSNNLHDHELDEGS